MDSLQGSPVRTSNQEEIQLARFNKAEVRNRFGSIGIKPVSLSSLRDRCHMGAKCIRKCGNEEHLKPDYPARNEQGIWLGADCHGGECWPKAVGLK